MLKLNDLLLTRNILAYLLEVYGKVDFLVGRQELLIWVTDVAEDVEFQELRRRHPLFRFEFKELGEKLDAFGAGVFESTANLIRELFVGRQKL